MTDTSSDNSSYYILNREYFSECYDQSANTAAGLFTYRKALLFFIIAATLFMLAIEPYVAWFILCLGFVELLSIRYKRSWWIARQMFSRAAGSKVTVRADDKGIYTESSHHQQSILWGDITDSKSTDKGFLLSHSHGTSYLSKSGLDKDLINFLAEKTKR